MQPNCGTIFTIATAFLSSLFSSFIGIVAFLWLFCLVVHPPCDAGTYTYPRLCNPFLFCRIDTREDANIHKAIACKYLSNNICTVVEEGTLMAQKVWRLCVLVFAHVLGFRGGNCNGLHTNTGFFLSIGKRYLFLL